MIARKVNSPIFDRLVQGRWLVLQLTFVALTQFGRMLELSCGGVQFVVQVGHLGCGVCPVLGVSHATVFNDGYLKKDRAKSIGQLRPVLVSVMPFMSIITLRVHSTYSVPPHAHRPRPPVPLSHSRILTLLCQTKLKSNIPKPSSDST